MTLLDLSLVLLILAPLPISIARADSAPFNAYDLIGAVNALRSSYGLAPFNINGSLMASAQAHSDYQASIQTMTHNGPGGITPNERAVGAGYSGRVSENIAVFTLGFDDSMNWVIFQAWSDDIHMNTMLNPQYLDVGAGVAVGGDRVYLTLDAGWPQGAYPLPTRLTWTPAGPSISGTESPAFEPILISTPQPDGSVVHMVGYGQSLIGIAGAYGIPVTELATLNKINPNQIYSGQKLIIRQAITPTSSTIPTQVLTQTPTILTTSTQTGTETPIPISQNPVRLTGIIIIIVCLIVLFIIIWVGRK